LKGGEPGSPLLPDTIAGREIQVPTALRAESLTVLPTERLIRNLEKDLLTGDFGEVIFSPFKENRLHILLAQLNLFLKGPLFQGMQGKIETGRKRIGKLFQTPGTPEVKDDLNASLNQIGFPYLFDSGLGLKRSFKIEIDGREMAQVPKKRFLSLLPIHC
jgi:hypothetical protein